MPSHQPEDVVTWGSGLFVTYRIHIGGTSYELQFETPSFESELWVPVFEEVTQSFKQVMDERAALAAGVLPHEAPDLEVLVPSEVFGRPICTYSVRPGHGRELGPHKLENGILLRMDLHALFDAGYVTVTPSLELRVSRRIREEFENGRDYYALEDSSVRLPLPPAPPPSSECLEWHGDTVFRR